MTGRSCSAQSPLARPAQGGAGAFRSFLECEFNAPQNAPSHGFRGFVAIKAGVKRAYRGPLDVRPFAEAARSAKASTAGKLQPNSSRLNCKTTRPQSSDGNSYGALRFWISRLPLFFQEQIKGSKNAPIARFDGLCCYQTRSSLSRLARRAAFQKPRRKAKAKASVTPESASWGVLSIRRAIRQSLPDGGRPGGCEPSGRYAWRWPGTACAWQRSSRSDGEPGHAGPAAIKHGIDKQAVAPRPCPWLTGTPGQPILDALPLTVAQCVSFGYGPSAGFSPPPGFRFGP